MFYIILSGIVTSYLFIQTFLSSLELVNNMNTNYEKVFNISEYNSSKIMRQ